MGLPYQLPAGLTRLEFVAQNSRLLVSGGAPGQGWLINLATSNETREGILSRAELLSGQCSFVRSVPERASASWSTRFDLEEVLRYSSSMGALRPLAVDECQTRWMELAAPR